MGSRKTVSFLLSLIFVTIVAGVYLFIAIAIVPYWQTLSGVEIQDWFANHFGRFATMMIPVHLVTIITTLTAYVLHRKEGWLWLVALVTMLTCEVAFSAYFGSTLNTALSSGMLDPELGLETLDQWDFLHIVRTGFIWITLVCLGVIGMSPNRAAE